MTTPDQFAAVRYLVDDVSAAVGFYTTHLGFTLRLDAAPAFADVVRGPLRLLLSGPAGSGSRAPPKAPLPAATVSTCSSTTSTSRSTGSATPACPSAAT